MQKVLLELLLLSSTALAVIGDGFIVLPVDKIQTNVGSGDFPNRLPIFEALEGVAKSAQEDINNMIQPVFGNGVLTGGSKYESSSDNKGSSWKYEMSYGISYAGVTKTIVYNNGVASTLSDDTQQQQTTIALANKDSADAGASTVQDGEQKSPSTANQGPSTTATSAVATTSSTAFTANLPFGLTAIPTEFWRILGLGGSASVQTLPNAPASGTTVATIPTGAITIESASTTAATSTPTTSASIAGDASTRPSVSTNLLLVDSSSVSVQTLPNVPVSGTSVVTIPNGPITLASASGASSTSASSSTSSPSADSNRPSMTTIPLAGSSGSSSGTTVVTIPNGSSSASASSSASSSSSSSSSTSEAAPSTEASSPVQRETGAFFLNLNNAQTLYYATLKVGTPEQEVQVMIDTGSSDLWFISSSNSQCKSNGGSVDCSKYGTFEKNASSTWHDNHTEYSISYFDGDKATGTMGQDNVTFAPGFLLENANFAVIDNTSSKIGVLGVGYPELEAVKPKYVNLPFAMKEQNLIAKVAYSLYLDSRHATQGYILFGGIDHAKYSGDLKSFDIVQSNGKYVYSQIPLTAVVSSLNNYTGAYDAPTVNGTHPPKVGAAIYNGTDSFNGGVDLGSKPALLDSGTTYSYLPRDQVESIVSLFGNATYNEQGKAYDVPCWVGNDGNYLEFNFKNEQYIQVPLSEYVISVGKDDKGVQECVFGMLPGSSSILGDNFMRSVYAVFDLEDNTISIAPAAFNDEHRIVPIE